MLKVRYRTLERCIFLSNLFLISFLLLFSCKKTTELPQKSVSSIYFGGDILTMEGPSPQYVESLVVQNGKIVFIGSLSEAQKTFPDAGKKDLKGLTLLPGFIDGHCHFGSFSGQAIAANLLPPPDAEVKNIQNIVSTLITWATPENIKLTGWIFGLGFDDSQLEDQRFPTKHDLDKVSKDIPVMIVHISGHFSVVNSKALEILGITSETPDPEGGVIRRENGSNEPNGVLEELASIPYTAKALTPKSEESLVKFLEAGQKLALSYGYTTAQEGRAMVNHDYLAFAAERNLLKIDVVSYVDYMYMDSLMASKWNTKDRSYLNHYRIGGIKVTLDGSPQGRTAWRTVPYLIPPEGQSKNYKGFPSIPKDGDVKKIYEKAFQKHWQVLTHANGDAAIDQMIRTLNPLVKKYGTKDRRDVLIHGIYVRDDQMDSLKEMNLYFSLFPLHAFYWGDWHIKLIGEELGNKISPTRTALDKGLPITIHTDAPVALPNLMRLVWIAVSRTSRSGKIIGEKECLTVYEALESITNWSAHQHFEENTKGTLSAGKLADMVILDKNPLKVPVDKIKNIVVDETIKEGRSVYKRSQTGINYSNK